jgi:hypothetical protein
VLTFETRIVKSKVGAQELLYTSCHALVWWHNCHMMECNGTRDPKPDFDCCKTLQASACDSARKGYVICTCACEGCSKLQHLHAIDSVSCEHGSSEIS